MVLDILDGLEKQDIPYEGQIIRVADEYDAIVSKRQYKTHIGISDTLKIIIENSKPNNVTNDLYPLSHVQKFGKVNPAIVKVLIKVVLDDIYYEISTAQDYIDYLEDNLKRFKKIYKYYNKMLQSKTNEKKEYFLEYMKLFFDKDENMGNFEQIYEDYQIAYDVRKAKIENLYKEVSIIKKLKV